MCIYLAPRNHRCTRRACPSQGSAYDHTTVSRLCRCRNAEILQGLERPSALRGIISDYTLQAADLELEVHARPREEDTARQRAAAAKPPALRRAIHVQPQLCVAITAFSVMPLALRVQQSTQDQDQNVAHPGGAVRILGLSLLTNLQGIGRARLDAGSHPTDRPYVRTYVRRTPGRALQRIPHSESLSKIR